MKLYLIGSPTTAGSKIYLEDLPPSFSPIPVIYGEISHSHERWEYIKQFKGEVAIELHRDTGVAHINPSLRGDVEFCIPDGYRHSYSA